MEQIFQPMPGGHNDDPFSSAYPSQIGHHRFQMPNYCRRDLVPLLGGSGVGLTYNPRPPRNLSNRAIEGADAFVQHRAISPAVTWNKKLSSWQIYICWDGPSRHHQRRLKFAGMASTKAPRLADVN